MGKYSQYNRQAAQAKQQWTIHPIWRGIGCLILVIMPIIAYAAADIFITWNQKAGMVPLPYDLYQRIGVVSWTVPILGNVLRFSFGSLRLGDVIFTAIWFMVGLGLLTLIYSFFYRFMAPPRYVGYDSPPVGKYRPHDGGGKRRR